MIQEPISTEETWLQGIPVSPGIALGKIKIQISGSKEPVAYDISPEEVDAELVRFHRALQTTADQIRTLRERMIQISGEKDASIFDAHILLLQDKIILQQVQTELLKRLQNVEHIFYVVMQNYMEVLRRVDDPYLRAKTADMEDVMQRVINNLRSTEPPEDEEETEKDQVLVAYDLTPSDTAAMDASLIHGFATEIGSSVSHTAILARSMGIPAVVGLDQALLRVESHSPAILDGYKGVLILKPTKETEEYYHRLQVEKEKAYKALEALRDLPTITRDGRNIRLSVNVEFPHEYSGIKEVGAEGVGLFRTEFFLLSNPSACRMKKNKRATTESWRKVAPPTASSSAPWTPAATSCRANSSALRNRTPSLAGEASASPSAARSCSSSSFGPFYVPARTRPAAASCSPWSPAIRKWSQPSTSSRNAGKNWKGRTSPMRGT